MYEVLDYPLRNTYDEQDIGAMINHIVSIDRQAGERNSLFVKQAKVRFNKFSGGQIVNKLAQIPISERRF